MQPRWWHRGPSRTRRLTAQRSLHTHAAAAANQVGGLQQKLASLDHQIAEQSRRVTVLDAQHAAWKRWYDGALPARYAGLAAAAEQARRAASRNAAVANAVATTTARVHAVNDTRPTPHATPVPEHLRQHAHDAHQRITTHLDSSETEID